MIRVNAIVIDVGRRMLVQGQEFHHVQVLYPEVKRGIVYRAKAWVFLTDRPKIGQTVQTVVYA